MLAKVEAFFASLLSKRLGVFIVSLFTVNQSKAEAAVKTIVSGVTALAYLYAETKRPSGQ